MTARPRTTTSKEIKSADPMFLAGLEAAKEFDALRSALLNAPKTAAPGLDSWLSKWTMKCGYKLVGVILYRQGGKSSSYEAVVAYGKRKGKIQ